MVWLGGLAKSMFLVTGVQFVTLVKWSVRGLGVALPSRLSMSAWGETENTIPLDYQIQETNQKPQISATPNQNQNQRKGSLAILLPSAF